MSKVIVIAPAPIADFSSTNGCANDSTVFISSTFVDMGAIQQWAWDFGDGTTSTDTDPIHIYAAQGIYWVNLTVTDTAGCSASVSHPVNVVPGPVSIFNYETQTCSGNQVQFNDMSTAAGSVISTWYWNFGDGTDTIVTAPANPDVAHTYANAGIYVVSLTVTSLAGCEATSTQTISIESGPAANFSFETSCLDQPVQFNDLSQSNGGGQIVSWAWNFGDPASGVSNVSNLQNPQHIYSLASTYDVTLIITNIDGCSDTIIKQVSVSAAPAVEFTWQSSCSEALTSFFTDATVVDINAIATYLWQFGDGGQSNIQDPQHLYAAGGNYNVTLTVTDTAGCSSSVTHQIVVSQLPVAYFSYTEPTCFQTATSFNDLSYTESGYITTWEWIFGDGNSTTVNFPANPNVSHQYANAGFYNVTLNITTSEGCTNSVTLQVQVIPNPVANFINSTSCLGGPVNFTDLSQANGGGQIVNWAWNFGDPTSGINNISGLQNPSHIYAQPGSYTVSLIVTTSNTCSDTLSKLIVIAPAPIVDFSSTSGCSNDTVQFTSSTFVDPLSTITWLWEFGDGTTSTEPDPMHIYSSQGIYFVGLTITDTAGCTAYVSHPVNVIPGPVALFNFTAPACSGSEVDFNDMSMAQGSVITSWFWDFGDGNTTTVTAPGNPDVSHVYASAGVYNVSLTVTNLEGCDASTSMNVIITVGPSAEFTFEQGCLGTPVSFTDQTSTNGGPAIVQWLWNFGDPASGVSNTSNLQNPVHIYNVAGSYNVLLTITSASGCQDTISHQVNVSPPPAVAFLITSGTCVGAPVSFEPDASIMDLSTIASYEWNFGDGSANSTSQNPTHTYNVASSFNVTLTIVDLTGCTNSISQQVSIGALPVAAFTFASACSDNATTFTDMSYTNTGEAIVGWSWTFGDPNAVPGSDTSSLQNPVYRYSSQGLYNVNLTVTTENGCESSIVIPVQVFPAPTAAFSYITNACANGAVSFQDASSSYMGAITSWEWEFAPGYTSTLQNPYHTFFHTDSCYNVRLIVTDMRGCSDTLIQEVCIPAGLEVAIDYTTTCHGDSTWFSPVVVAPAGDSLVLFDWNFDDLASGIYNTSDDRNPVHYFQTPGSYLVSLTAIDINNCTTTIYQSVEVKPLPTPSFSYVAGLCDSTIFFTDHSNGNGANIAQWIWNYGDGNIDTLLAGPADTSHFYNTSGIFNVSLTTVTVDGCEASYSLSVDRMPCITAAFEQIDTLICERHSLTFEDQSVCGNPIDSWKWYFGDGDSLVYHTFTTSVSHIYQQSGTYNVQLIVSTTLEGKTVSDTVSQTVKVLISPVAGFVAPDVCLNVATEFTDKSTWTESRINKWNWDFGNPLSVEDTTSVHNPVYLYDHAGEYFPMLTVTNEFGCTDTISHLVRVHYLPVADFSYTLACQNNHTYFTDLSDSADAAIDQWWWKFRDSLNMLGMAGVQHPDFIFENVSTYEVELIVVNANGCSDTISQQLEVNPKPISAFSMTEDYENTQGRVLFTNGSIGANAYEWDFSTGIESYEVDPVVDFTADGTYEITLVTMNEYGCPDTLRMDYNLMFKGLWIPNAFSPNNPNAEVRLFKPVGINLESYKIEVFDTWGNQLWTSSELDENGSPAEGWNGVFNGNLLPQDTYMWKATGVFKDGTIWQGRDVGNNTNLYQKPYGTVTLIR
ncbi:MAG: PKD domain-containing protein [Lentimicrobium sp.]|nr:PKD domain-containing protein [Lentimicrobium sp.]